MIQPPIPSHITKEEETHYLSIAPGGMISKRQINPFTPTLFHPPNQKKKKLTLLIKFFFSPPSSTPILPLYYNKKKT